MKTKELSQMDMKKYELFKIKRRWISCEWENKWNSEKLKWNNNQKEKEKWKVHFYI